MQALEHFRRAAESCRLRIAQEVARAGAAGAAQPTPEAQALTQILKDIEARIEEEELEVPRLPPCPLSRYPCYPALLGPVAAGRQRPSRAAAPARRARGRVKWLPGWQVPVDAAELAQDPQAPLQGVAAEQEGEFEAVDLPPPRKRGRGDDAAAGAGAAAEARGEGTGADGGAAGEAAADGGAGDEAESPRGKTRRTGT